MARQSEAALHVAHPSRRSTLHQLRSPALQGPRDRARRRSEGGMSPTLRFLQALHGTDLTGFIEVRLIEDKKGGKLVLRRWYASPDALVADLEFLLQQSKLRN